jgi:WXG100 family type VII secretion target
VANSITVGYEGLQQAAQQLRSGKDELESTLRDLQSVIDGLTSAGFKTRVASGRFGQCFRQWDSSTNQLISSLDAIARAIRDAQQNHEQTDRSLAEGVGAVGATGAAAGAAKAALPKDQTKPGWEVVPENQVKQRLGEMDRRRLWQPEHEDGSRNAYDRVTFNGKPITRNRGLQVTVRKSMMPESRAGSPPPAFRENLAGFDQKYPYKLDLSHMWADRLGGPNAARNFIAGHAHTNRGGMAYVEGRMADAVNRAGERGVRLLVLPHYVGDEPIPREIVYAWKGPGDRAWTAVNIENLP